MNPIWLVVWALAGNLGAVILAVAAMVLVLVTLALYEWRHPW